jgi:hypothetical protein
VPVPSTAAPTETKVDKPVDQNLTPEQAYQNARDTLVQRQNEYDKLNVTKLMEEGRTAQGKLFQDATGKGGFIDVETQTNTALIDQYKKERADLLKGGDSNSSAVEGLANELGLPKALPDPSAAGGSLSSADYFTPITIEVSASSDKKTSIAKAHEFGATVAYSFLLGGVSATVENSGESSKATNDLVNSSVKISFECMRVDIQRSWLRPELFQDQGLTAAPGTK